MTTADKWFNRVIIVILLALYGLAAWLLRPANEQNEQAIQLALLLWIGGLPFIGLLLFHRPILNPPAVRPQNRLRPVRLWPLVGGIVLLMLVAQANGLRHDDTEIPALLMPLLSLSHHLQFIGFVAGVGLVVWGIAGGERWRLSLRRDWLLWGILALALVVRLWQLETGGTHRFLDELHYADAVARLLQTPNIQLFTPFSELVTAFTWLFPYGQSWFVSLFGASLTSLRLLSVLFGVATVAATYGLGYHLFNRHVALWAAFILATFPPHVHLTRIGINNSADPFFGVLALLFLARAVRYGRGLDYALAGACLALTQYFYEGGRLLYPPLFITWMSALVLFRQRPPVWRGMLISLAVFIIVISPYYYTLVAHQEPLVPRLSAVGAGENQWAQALMANGNHPLKAALWRISLPIRGYVQLPDTSWFYANGMHNGGFILPLLVPLALLGAAALIWRLYTAGGSLLALWLLGAAVGNAFIQDPISAPRYLVVFPALALTLAVGVAVLVDGLQLRGRALRWGAGVLALAIGGYQIGYYFMVHLPRYDTGFYVVRDDGLYFKDGDDALFRAMQLPPRTQVHIIGKSIIWNFDITAIRRYYGREDIAIEHIFPDELTEDMVRNLPANVPHAFFIEPEDYQTYILISRYFNLTPAQFSPWDVPLDKQFILYYAPRQ